jgi:exosortase
VNQVGTTDDAVNMVEVVAPQAVHWKIWSSRRPHILWGTLLIAFLVMGAYYHVLAKLVSDWWQIPDNTHGFLVAPFAVFVAWSKRDTLVRTKCEPTWAGVALVALGLVILVLGTFGAELFLARLSFVIVIAGLVLGFGGTKLCYELRFALLVLLLAIPIPAIIFSQITLPLQLLASQLATTLLRVCNVPVLRDGNVIQLPRLSLEVVEACSGIRSIMSLFALSVFYGYFLEKSTWRRVVLACASIPIAISTNAVRILATGLCVQYWDPDKALGFFHEFSGLVMFLVSLVCLFVVHRILGFSLPKRRLA